MEERNKKFRDTIKVELKKFNANMRKSSKNAEQRMFFVEDARREQNEKLVKKEDLDSFFDSELTL